MNHGIWFSDPPKRRCLGVTLEPLTLGHLFLLETHGLACNGRLTLGGLGDLVLAVLLCSFSFDDARRALRSRWFNPFARFWAWRVGKFHVEQESEKFSEYFREQTEYPPIKIKMSTDAREYGAPLCWRLLTMLMQDLHMAEKDALAVPVRRANCFWATLGEKNGTLQFPDGSDDLLMRMQKEGRVIRQEELN